MNISERSLRFTVASIAGLVITTTAGCGQRDVASYAVPVPPTAAEVKALVDVGYQRPALHAVVAAPPLGGNDRVIVWSRRYDGVDLGSDARSTLQPDGVWHTGFLRELAEPEPVRRADLWSFERAAAQVGLRDGLVRGTVKARLLYHPALRLATNAKRAADVEHVVDHWRLVIELDDAEGRRTYHVDAYSGEKIGDWSHEVTTGLNVTTVKYGADVIDATMLPFVRGFLYRDTVRTSLLDPTTGTPVNGQGIALGIPKSTTTPLSWVVVVRNTADIDNDIAFTLEQAWDYFSTTFGRRGLRNLAASSTATANDAIAYYDPTWASLNASMDSSTGLLRIAQPAGWQNYVTADVIAHEWTHAVYTADAGHDDSPHYYGGTGGIDEANSDLFGELIEARARHVAGLQPTDEVMNDGIGWIHGQDTPATARNMCSPLLSADHGYRDIWSPDLDDPTAHVDAHYAATPFDRVFCLLARGMVKNGSPNDPELQSLVAPNGFAPLGSAAVAKLEYQALAFLHGVPGPLVKYIDVRHALLDAATVLYGEYSDPYKAIQDAFAVIGVDAPADRTPPVITLTSGTLLSQTRPIAVAIGDANPITSVKFQIDLHDIGTLTAPPWQLTPPFWWEGDHTLYVTATDAHRNTATTKFAVTYDSSGPGVTVTEVTPCPQWWCADYQYKKLYRVDAHDFSGVASETLFVDGPPVGNASGASNVFTVTYTVGGQHQLRASAADTVGNVGTTDLLPFDVDLTPPTFTSGPTLTPDPAVEGRFTYSFCVAPDPSGWISYIVLDGVKTPAQQLSSPPSCTTMQLSGVPVGSHAYALHVPDRWNNDNVTVGTITLPAIPPTLSVPVVTVDTVTLGHVLVSTSYGATHGIASVALRICDSGGCGAAIVFTPSNSPADQSGHVFNVNSLQPTHSYYAQVSVTGFNHKTTTKNSATFTIPSGQTNHDIVYTEQEYNGDWQSANSVPDGTNVIRGATSGGDDDWFFVYAPEGKSVCVAGAITNNNTTCTTGVTLYNEQGGWIAGGNGNQLFPSRSAIGASDYVCRGVPAAPYNFVLINVENPGLGSCSLTYDVLVKIQ